MENEKFLNRYRITSARASWHSYNGGAYFITVNTAHRIHYFGEINHGEMYVTPIGQFVSGNLQDVSAHFPYAEIPLFVVMPNHVHAIVFINGNKTPSQRRVISTGFGNVADDCGGVADDCRDVARRVSTVTVTVTVTDNGKNVKMQKISNHSGWLSVCIGGIKSAVTKYARENNICFEWQTRFHDHIIRDTDEMDRIVDYIENNVARWQQDHHRM